jgi:hypothetical protein
VQAQVSEVKNVMMENIEKVYLVLWGLPSWSIQFEIKVIFGECFWSLFYIWIAGPWSWREDRAACWQDRESPLTGLQLTHSFIPPVLASVLKLCVVSSCFCILARVQEQWDWFQVVIIHKRSGRLGLVWFQAVNYILARV